MAKQNSKASGMQWLTVPKVVIYPADGFKEITYPVDKPDIEMAYNKKDQSSMHDMPPSYAETTLYVSSKSNAKRQPLKRIQHSRGETLPNLKKAPFGRTGSLPEGTISSRKKSSGTGNGSIASIDKELSRSSTLDKKETKDALCSSGGSQSLSDKRWQLTAQSSTGREDDEVFSTDYHSCVDVNIRGERISRPASRENHISTSDVQELAVSLLRNRERNHDMLLDENNVPCIDREYTPPSTPVTYPSVNAMVHLPQFEQPQHQHSFKKLRRKFTSLRFRRANKAASFRSRAGSDSSMSRRGPNPTISITGLRDGGEDSVRTALLPNADKSFMGGSNVKMDGSKVQFIGDEASLYGTPKEELSPLKDIESQRGNHSATNYLKDQIISFFQPSDNKLAMKLFGNKNALMKEKQRQKAAGNWVVHPCSNFRFYWDLFMLILLIANLIILPVAISFFNDDLSPRWIVFNSVSDTVFLLDLIINFRTGIIADNFADEIILEPKKIAIHYLKTWFFLDLISSVPLDYIILLFSPEANVTQIIHAGRALRIFRLVKLLSLLRLLRLSRLVRYVSQWEEFLQVAGKFMRIFNLVCLMLLLGHWNGCMQWLVPILQGVPSNSWIAINELEREDWDVQYTWSLFKALSHMLCIGYGRFPPQNPTDVWLTMISMLIGATCYAMFVGHATTLIQSFDTSKRLYREKFKQVEEYMIYRKLPRNLRQRITDYYEHRYQGKMFDEDNILGELNECLKEEIVNYNCRALVASVPFFTHADPNFVSEVVTKLNHEVFQPGDYIIKEGTRGTKMYFIQEGIVDIVTKNGEVATSLSDGSYFGEICLLTRAKRVASVRAEVYCYLYSLSVEHFNAVLEHYPVMRRTMESVAAERLNKIGINRGIVSNRENFEEDINTVNEIIRQTTPMHSSSSEESGDSGDSSLKSAARKRKKRRSAVSPAKDAHKYPGVREGIKTVLHLKKSKSECCVHNGSPAINNNSPKQTGSCNSVENKQPNDPIDNASVI